MHLHILIPPLCTYTYLPIEPSIQHYNLLNLLSLFDTYLLNPQDETVQQIGSFFAAKAGHLPSAQAMLMRGFDDWVAGPRIMHRYAII
jgi:hypothetical protein